MCLNNNCSVFVVYSVENDLQMIVSFLFTLTRPNFIGIEVVCFIGKCIFLYVFVIYFVLLFQQNNWMNSCCFCNIDFCPLKYCFLWSQSGLWWVCIAGERCLLTDGSPCVNLCWHFPPQCNNTFRSHCRRAWMSAHWRGSIYFSVVWQNKPLGYFTLSGWFQSTQAG